MPARRHRVAAVVYDELCVFEFGILVELFGLPRPELPVEWYRFGLCSLDPGPLANRVEPGQQVVLKRRVGLGDKHVVP